MQKPAGELKPIDRDPSNPQFRRAAALALKWITHHGDPKYTPSEEHIDRYINNVDARETLYMFTSHELGFMAMAAVTHDDQEGTTLISEIVVEPDLRGTGLHVGTNFMGELANAALAHGNTQLRLHARVPEFFTPLGFAEDPNDSGFMIASAAQVAAASAA